MGKFRMMSSVTGWGLRRSHGRQEPASVVSDEGKHIFHGLSDSAAIESFKDPYGIRNRGKDRAQRTHRVQIDRKSTRLNSSHSQISYAVFCLKKKKHYKQTDQRAQPTTYPIRHTALTGRLLQS